MIVFCVLESHDGFVRDPNRDSPPTRFPRVFDKVQSFFMTTFNKLNAFLSGFQNPQNCTILGIVHPKKKKSYISSCSRRALFSFFHETQHGIWGRMSKFLLSTKNKQTDLYVQFPKWSNKSIIKPSHRIKPVDLCAIFPIWSLGG